ncbi:unnamed protein product [Orchesella dallaii]|uniref:Uncharacterized protein n=1 Tax=Orchesella dallaii TaxID=48710 RepID=A0ABP1QWV1_9HEXA
MRVYSDPDPKTTTRIIYNDNNNYAYYNNDFRYREREMYDGQLDFVSAHNGNNSFSGRQMGGSFHNNRQNWNYSQSQHRLQGQTRFVKIQGPKMHPHQGLRHIMVKQQQRQNPNRRMNVSGKNYYNNNFNRNRRMIGGNKMSNSRKDYYNNYSTDPIEQVKHGSESENRSYEVDTGRDNPDSKSSQERRMETDLTGKTHEDLHEDDKKKVNKKLGFLGSSSSPSIIKDSLSYEDLTENSDENDDAVADLRERLLRRKHEQVAKREPGELDSEDDKIEEHASVSRTEGNRKMKKRRRIQSNEDGNLKKNSGSRSGARSTPFRLDKEVCDEKQLPENIQPLQARENGNGALLNDPYVPSGYKCQPPDNRSTQQEKKIGLGCRQDHTENNSAKRFCLAEAEIAELKERMATMKRLLRETRDKLLESKIIGSKKVKRMEEEMSQLKDNLEESLKKENELKTTLKELENELASRRTELGKLTMLYEVEREEKLRHEQDLTRTYQDRLTIEVEKLRALFDIEVSKMQAFYLSSMCYEDSSALQFLKPQKRDLISHLSLSAHQKVTQAGQKDIVPPTNVSSEINPPFFHSLYAGSGANPTNQSSASTSSSNFYRNNSCTSNMYPYNNGFSMQDIYSSNTNTKGEEVATGRYSPANSTSSSHSTNTASRF